MNKSSKDRLQQMRWIRREFWIGNSDWENSLRSLMQEHKMSHDEACTFLGDSTNLDAAAKLQARLIAIPFGVSLVQPSIML